MVEFYKVDLMKPLSKMMIAMALIALSVGCAKEEGQQAAAVPPAATCTSNCTGGVAPTPPPGGTPIDSYASGSTAELVADAAKLRTMFYNSNPNNPTNIRINIDLTRDSDSVIIAYTESGAGANAGKVVEAGMGVVNPCVKTGYMPGNCSSTPNRQYNGYVNQGGTNMWKGFFQDEYGAIVVVVDKFFDQGDGSGNQFASGSVWFQNFNRYYPNNPYQGPLSMCWQISLGPYDCRTFLSGNVVNMISSKFPTNKGPDNPNYYQQLGTFSGISVKNANF
jgi:hypothetical protein